MTPPSRTCAHCHKTLTPARSAHCSKCGMWFCSRHITSHACEVGHDELGSFIENIAPDDDSKVRGSVPDEQLYASVRGSRLYAPELARSILGYALGAGLLFVLITERVLIDETLRAGGILAATIIGVFFSLSLSRTLGKMFSWNAFVVFLVFAAIVGSTAWLLQIV